MKQYLKMFTEFRGLTVEPTMGGSLSLHGCKAYYAAHAINSHDELVEMNKELIANLERCATELASMIDRHNEHNISDDSWMYDHQTPWEAMQIIVKVKGGAE